MREITSSITKRGQLTVPAEVRRLLGLRTPDRVVFVVDEESKTVRLEVPRYPDLGALAGAPIWGRWPAPRSGGAGRRGRHARRADVLG